MVSVVVALGLSACNPVDDRLWPSIRPPSAARPSPPEPAPFFQPLPGSIWEWSGVFSLVLGAAGVGFVYWRFPGLREEFSSLRDQTRRLHERRDRSTADLAHMARSLRDLEQEITVLRRELARRDPPAAPPQASPPPPAFTAPPQPAFTPPPALSPLPPPPTYPTPPAPTLSSASPSAGPTPELPHFSPPSPPGRSRPRPTPQPDVRRLADGPSPLATPAPPTPEAPIPGQELRSPAPTPVSLLAERPDPIPVADAGADAWRPKPGPGLDALIDAINSRGRSPIEGVTCVELDIAPPPEGGDVGYEGLAPRLRMVARGGRFLLVMVEGDAWLFPTIETLDRFKEAQIDASIFQAQPDSIDRPQLILPAMLREVGGLWEVTDPGKLLVPAR
ncbi:MAG: hypothetical protein VKK43_03325 [Synechococcaceae cyanobacterium]|nr:hypothetical protein [Synechococcaceae cyanobacterium]